MSIALKNVCRTCLMESDDVKSLYESCSTEIEACVAEILMYITPLTFDSCDGMPTSICYGCIKEMLQFYKFVQKCCESDKRLRSHTVKINQSTADIIDNITIIDDHTNSLTYENDERNCNTQSLQCPLTDREIKNELEQEMDFKEHTIDVKTEPNTCRETMERINSTEENTGVANLYKSLSPLKQLSKEQDGQDTGKQFETESLPVERIHTKEQTFTCSVCNQEFAQKINLTRHIRTHTGGKPYKCTHCKRSFSHQGSLTTHMRIHTHDKPFTCWVCNEEFAHKINLTRHIRTHTGEKPYKCTICEHSFSVKSSLTTHMRIHTHEKPFACSVCSQKFAHKCSLTNHMRIHTGEKPHKCTLCKRSFSRKERLISHKCIYTPEKPFSCAVCNLKFAQMISLTLHVRIHT